MQRKHTNWVDKPTCTLDVLTRGWGCPEHSATCRTESPISRPPPPSLLVRFFSVPSGPLQQEVRSSLFTVTVSLRCLTTCIGSSCVCNNHSEWHNNYLNTLLVDLQQVIDWGWLSFMLLYAMGSNQWQILGKESRVGGLSEVGYATTDKPILVGWAWE